MKFLGVQSDTVGRNQSQSMIKTTCSNNFLMRFILLLCLSAFSMVQGCGQILPGQERIINYNLTFFTLPAAFVYTNENGVPSQVPSISRSEEGAKRVVRNLILQTVEDVLYQQGRSAGLSDEVTSLILQQLNVEVNYTPLKCDVVFTDPKGVNNNRVNMKMNCLIVSGTVTNICMEIMAANGMYKCNTADAMNAKNLVPVPPQHLTISGTLKTSNSIMAMWSTQMWQSVLNRVVRGLTSGAFASNFYGASVTIN